MPLLSFSETGKTGYGERFGKPPIQADLKKLGIKNINILPKKVSYAWDIDHIHPVLLVIEKDKEGFFTFLADYKGTNDSKTLDLDLIDRKILFKVK